MVGKYGGKVWWKSIVEKYVGKYGMWGNIDKKRVKRKFGKNRK